MTPQASPSVSTETLDDLEIKLGELVRTSNMTPDRVVKTIAEHAKAIIRSATAQSRIGLSDLFSEMQNMDSFISQKERDLCAEADRLMVMAVNARQAADMVRDTIKGWQNEPLKTNGAS
jgi:hypothetical protein